MMTGWLWLGIKLMFVVAFGIYSVFAMVVIKQVKVMNQTVEVERAKVIETLAWAHLLVALLLVIAAIVIL